MAQAALKQTVAKPKPAPKVKDAEATKAPQTAKEMAQPEPRELHHGNTPSSFRVGKKLTPLRHDYRCGQMSELDTGFLRDCITLADKQGKFKRLNADAGRLGRLYRLEFVKYDEIGVTDTNQIITLTPKATDFVKAITATPKATDFVKAITATPKEQKSA